MTRGPVVRQVRAEGVVLYVCVGCGWITILLLAFAWDVAMLGSAVTVVSLLAAYLISAAARRANAPEFLGPAVCGIPLAMLAVAAIRASLDPVDETPDEIAILSVLGGVAPLAILVGLGAVVQWLRNRRAA